jgi:cellulose synthase/poly-beta-1,6-N-acetylglucosamine synthase-like glycosyltransferase
MFDEHIEPALFWLWIVWTIQAGWGVFNQVHFLQRIERFRKRNIRRDTYGESCTEPAVVIAAVKGCDDRFEANLRRLIAQDYPKYRVIFTMESADDAAHEVVRRIAQGAPCRVDIVIAGHAPHGGQKVHNLLAAVAQLEAEDRVIAFADADVAADDQWLRRLVGPLSDPLVGASTGYRWLVPADEAADNLPTQLASVINSSIATLQGPPRRTHVWGGSTAVLRRIMEESNLVDHWRGALSDDYQLDRAIRASGKTVRFVVECLVASPARFTWASLMEFGRRQYLITRIYAPGIWLIGFVLLSLYIAGWLSVVAAAVMGVSGWGWGLVAAGVVYGAEIVRGSLRQQIVKRILSSEARHRLSRALLLDRFATPLWKGLHLAILLSSVWGSTITWARITYRMRGRQDVEVLRRE